MWVYDETAMVFDSAVTDVDGVVRYTFPCFGFTVSGFHFVWSGAMNSTRSWVEVYGYESVVGSSLRELEEKKRVNTRDQTWCQCKLCTYSLVA